MTEPAWHPDPTGRNHYRWWDGTQWTDSVSNNGQVGVDPVQAHPAQAAQPAPVQAAPAQPHAPVVQAPVAPAVQQPAAGGQPPFASTPVPAAAAPKKNLLKIIVPIVAVVAVAVVLFVVLGGGDDKGGGKFGVIDADLPTRDSIVSFKYTLKKGDVIRVRAEPDDNLDVFVAFVADAKTANAFGAEVEDILPDLVTDFNDFLTDAGDLFSDSDLGNLASLPSLQDTDSAGDGGAEADFFIAVTGGTYTMIVGSVDAASRGKVRLVVEKLDKQMPIDTFDGFSDFETFFSDEADFFSDSDFFSSDRTFTP